MASSDSEGASQTQNSRKRPRTAKAAKDGDDSKKARGRPRVEAQDETAADRRRTQIRLAQRAYRQRKETTISSLKKQVGDLQGTIEDMNKAFLQFNDRAVSSGMLGVNSDFARELKNTTEQFLALARNASTSAGSDGEEQDDDQIVAATPKKTNPPTGPHEQALDLTMRDSSAYHDIGWGYAQKLSSTSSSARQSAEPQNEFLPGVRLQDATQLIQRFREPNSTSYIFGLDDINHSTTGANDDVMDTNAFNNLNSFNALIPSPPAIPDKDSNKTLTLADGPFAVFPSASQRMTPPPQISPTITTKLGLPYTYSFQETTFARRLHRAAIERAFHLISQAEFRPQRFAEVFGLSLRFSNRNDIRQRMRHILSRGPNESLDNCGGPWLNFGGAGTHYPKRDGRGNITNKPETWSERRIGPYRRLSQLQQQQSIGMDMAETMMLGDDEVPAGYEGEWFDADDVEGYLEERGLRLEAQAHFVEGEVSDIDEGALGPEVGRTNAATPATIADLSPYAARSPGASALAGASSEKEPQQQSNKRPESASPWNGIFHDLASFDRMSGFDTASLFPEGMALDLSPMGRMNDFGSSAWFDEPSFCGSGTSPMLTTGSTAAESTGNDTSSLADAANGAVTTTGARKRTRTVTVDVSKMIDELIRGAVCLGRTPGWRRKNVDQALYDALIAVH